MAIVAASLAITAASLAIAPNAILRKDLEWLL
jgi:hypothetical protein